MKISFEDLEQNNLVKRNALNALHIHLLPAGAVDGVLASVVDHVSWVSGLSFPSSAAPMSHHTTHQHTTPIIFAATNYAPLPSYQLCPQLPICSQLPIMLPAANYAPSCQLCSQLPIMLPAANYAPSCQLCSQLPIMLPAANYAHSCQLYS